MASRASLHPLLGLGRAGTGVRWAEGGLALLALASLALVAWLFDLRLAGLAFVAVVLAAAAYLLVRAGSAAGTAAALPQGRDWSLLHAALIDGVEATIVVDREGRLVTANAAYEKLFGGPRDPVALFFAEDGTDRFGAGVRAAWRDGEAKVVGLKLGNRLIMAILRRAGQRGDHLVCRFRRADDYDPVNFTRALVAGRAGVQLGKAGVMMVLADASGRLVAANDVFSHRALGSVEDDPQGIELTTLLDTAADGSVRLARDPESMAPIRVVTVPFDENPAAGPALFLLLDEDPEVVSAAAARGTATAHLHSLLAMLPLGLALVERDGRFLFLNEAFRRAAGLAADDAAVYPSDLVAEEDKGTVSDAVRRFAAGRALPGDLAVRLKHKPDEPVALTIANAKGLGDASVLLSLKDNTEESKLKRQIAQATKMQAVGQLAGGVAHDFNNILTAIIGHCDLMAMRHTPGDIDYDDIQQIKHNSNRAAALTRQLLAFSRQQTLRPQILQLPEIIAEISNLLRRLLGETVRLEVKHGRNLGLVRADPGQLEQVIVNLAVNARDAMPQGGTLTLETCSISPPDVRRMRSEILPIGAYTALRVVDTGTGIPDEIIAKIFEPFFTTKEVGKGTGLGLSTVYGIVKQTDGWIFADSVMGKGTTFTIYLPVHTPSEASQAEPAPVPVRVENTDVWGTGTILLVEDEAMVRAVAERALIRQGYAVRTAGNGEEALELLESGEPIDLLISDVVMPTMDGPTLVREARARFPDLRVLFMSGYAEEQLRKSIDIERVRFLSKPFSVQQLGVAARDALADTFPEHDATALGMKIS